MDLSAKYSEGENGLPKITIYDKNRNADLVSIRTKVEAKGYFRNLIEKERIWVLLTKVKELPNNPKVPKQQKTPTAQPVTKKPATPNSLPPPPNTVPAAGAPTANLPPPVNNRV